VEIAILGLKPKIQKKINSKKKGKNGGNVSTRDRTQSLSITGSAISQLGYVRICDNNTASNIY
jgi:hypothetical protein